MVRAANHRGQRGPQQRLLLKPADVLRIKTSDRSCPPILEPGGRAGDAMCARVAPSPGLMPGRGSGLSPAPRDRGEVKAFAIKVGRPNEDREGFARAGALGMARII